MNPEIINSFVFPNYKGILAHNAIEHVAFPGESGKRRVGKYKIQVIINNTPINFVSINQAALNTGVSTFALTKTMKNGSIFYKQNGDKIEVKRIVS